MNDRWRCSRVIQNAAIIERKNPTESENALWQVLRKLRRSGLIFRRQVPLGRFILDFYCPSMKMAVEVDGSVHEQPDIRGRDAERTNILECEFGLRVIRFKAGDVVDNPQKIVDEILEICRSL